MLTRRPSVAQVGQYSTDLRQQKSQTTHTSNSGSGPLSTEPQWALAAHTVHWEWGRRPTLSLRVGPEART